MKKLLFVLCTLAIVNVRGADDTTKSVLELQANGVFAFPQSQATVLCDTPTLRFAVWNNRDYLFAQAILWTDDDASTGKAEDNREIGDWSELMLDLDGNGKPTKNVDRNYTLNPWPGMEGMYYQIVMGPGSTTGLESDSRGRGAIRYIKSQEGNLIRVDTYLIPMAEISRQVGDKIRIAYWGFSPKPALTVNSTGFDRAGKAYYGHSIPWSQYHDYVLTSGGDFDETQVPEGRKDISLSTHHLVPTPKVGDRAPEISAKEWINLKSPPSLASLHGKVVLVEFWATWCGPCIDGISHLNEIQRKYSGRNFQLLSLVLEGHQTMDPFLTKRQVDYPIGLDSGSLDDYGVPGIPYAFVMGPDGKILWEGDLATAGMEDVIAKALAP